MNLVMRVMDKGGRQWIARIGVDPISIDCDAGDEDDLLEPDAAPIDLGAASELFSEMTRRREADGWVEREWTRSLRCFYKPEDPEEPYWSIQLQENDARQVKVSFGRPGPP
jgi:hypothetical protein